MNTRQRQFEGYVVQAGLKLLDWRVPRSQGGRVGGNCQASNGATKRFSIASRDSGREDLNILGWMKRFAQENTATALSQALETAKSQTATAPLPNKKPRSILRVIQQPAKAPASVAPPAPTPVPPPVAATAPAMNQPSFATPIHTQITDMTKPAAKKAPSVRMTRIDFHKLTEWIKTIDVKAYQTVQQLADSAAEALSIVVTHAHARDGLDVLGIEHFKRPKASTASPAMELAQATATAVYELMIGMGERPPQHFVLALQRSGIDPSKLARKAA